MEIHYKDVREWEGMEKESSGTTDLTVCIFMRGIEQMDGTLVV